MSYRVLFHVGDSVDLKTKVSVGDLAMPDGVLAIGSEVAIPLSTLQSVELFRMHGLGRMLRIEHTGGTLFVSVIRFAIGDFFALVNFRATGTLRDELAAAVSASRT